MSYIEIETRKTVTIHHVRRAHPHLSLPDGRDYPELGYRLIHPTPRPEALPNHYVAADLPVEVDGDYYQAWRQVELTPPEPEVPQEVSRFQARMALHHFDMFDAAEAYCTSPEAPLEVREAWVAAQVFRRNSPTIMSLKDSPLALTDEQLDQLFTYADAIEA